MKSNAFVNGYLEGYMAKQAAKPLSIEQQHYADKLEAHGKRESEASKIAPGVKYSATELQDFKNNSPKFAQRVGQTAPVPETIKPKKSLADQAQTNRAELNRESL
jgi:hypothetical protein